MSTEIVAEFDDAGHAAAAKANLDLFIQWAVTADLSKPVPPALILVITQTKLNPHEDLPRKSDWSGGTPPGSRIEGACVVIEAPRSKAAREVIGKVLANSHPIKIGERAGAGGGAFGGKPRILAPMLAAGMIALSLERLGILHWMPALALFVLLGIFVLGIASQTRRRHA